SLNYPHYPRNQRLFFHNFAEIRYQLFHWDELACDTLPDQLAVFIDQEVVAIGHSLCTQSAISADDFCVRIAEEGVFGIHRFFEFLVRCCQIRGNTDDFDVHFIELGLINTELGNLPCSAGGEGHGEESQKHFLLACKVLHPERPATPLG